MAGRLSRWKLVSKRLVVLWRRFNISLTTQQSTATWIGPSGSFGSFFLSSGGRKKPSICGWGEQTRALAASNKRKEYDGQGTVLYLLPCHEKAAKYSRWWPMTPFPSVQCLFD